MRLTTIELTADNVSGCASLWADRGDFQEPELGEALRQSAMLLASGRAQGRLVVEEGGRPTAFGLTTFVTEGFAEAYLAAPYQQVGRRLLLDPVERGAVLDAATIGRCNASRGLQMVVLNQGYELIGPMEDKWGILVGTLLQAFVEIHRGYRLDRIINEVFGDDAIKEVHPAMVDICARFERLLSSGARLRSAVWVLSRLEAHRRKSLLLPMFLYNPPRVRFTAAERALLQESLCGSTDRELAGRLRIRPTAVKARWSRLQERAKNNLPDLFPEGHTLDQKSGRGAQIRHLILEYVRTHPSELTPYEDGTDDIKPEMGGAS